MNERRHNIIVGFTTLSGVVGLIVLLMLFGYMPGFLQDGYDVRIDLPRAAGLHNDARVRLAGIDIGKVTSVSLKQPPEIGVIVMAQIRSNTLIPTEAVPTIVQPLLGGGSTIDFVLDQPIAAEPAYLPTDGTAHVQGDVPTFGREFLAAIESPMENLERITDQFEQLSNEWTRVGANVNALIESRSVASVDAGEATGNMSTVLARMDQRLAELEAVLDGINRYVHDEALYADIRQTAANSRDLTERAAVGVDALRDRYVDVADNLNEAIVVMRQTIELAGQPDGTLGRLLTDPALYENLNDASQRLQRAIDEISLLVQKWRAEGLPVRF